MLSKFALLALLTLAGCTASPTVRSLDTFIECRDRILERTAKTDSLVALMDMDMFSDYELTCPELPSSEENKWEELTPRLIVKQVLAKRGRDRRIDQLEAVADQLAPEDRADHADRLEAARRDFAEKTSLERERSEFGGESVDALLKREKRWNALLDKWAREFARVVKQRIPQLLAVQRARLASYSDGTPYTIAGLRKAEEDARKAAGLGEDEQELLEELVDSVLTARQLSEMGRENLAKALAEKKRGQSQEVSNAIDAHIHRVSSTWKDKVEGMEEERIRYGKWAVEAVLKHEEEFVLLRTQLETAAMARLKKDGLPKPEEEEEEVEQ